MMTTRRSLFVFGALLAVGVLLAPQAAFAQAPTFTDVRAADSDADGAKAIVTFTEDATADNLANVSHYEVLAVTGRIATIAAVQPATLTDLFKDSNKVAGGVREVTVSGLEPLTWYSFAVRQVDTTATTPAEWVFASTSAEGQLYTSAGAGADDAGIVSQVMATPVADSYDKLTVTWVYGHTGTLSADVGFNIYYTKGDKVALLSTEAQIAAADMMDVGTPGPSMQTAVTTGTMFEAKLTGLEGGTDYVVNVLPYMRPLKSVGNDATIPTAATAKTNAANPPSGVRDVTVSAGDKELLATWMAPVNTGGQTLTITGYKVRWRTSQTSDSAVGSWSTYPPATDTKTKLTATEYKIKGLYNDVMYDVQVNAYNSAGGESVHWLPASVSIRERPREFGDIR